MAGYSICASRKMNPMKEDRAKASSPMYTKPKLMTVKTKA